MVSISTGAIVVAAVTGNSGSAGTTPGVGVSKEQGCQNLVDALGESAARKPDTNAYVPDLDSDEMEDWDSVVMDPMDGLTNYLTDTMASVSEEIG